MREYKHSIKQVGKKCEKKVCARRLYCKRNNIHTALNKLVKNVKKRCVHAERYPHPLCTNRAKYNIIPYPVPGIDIYRGSTNSGNSSFAQSWASSLLFYLVSSHRRGNENNNC